MQSRNKKCAVDDQANVVISLITGADLSIMLWQPFSDQKAR